MSRQLRFEIYQAPTIAPKWYWRLRAANGRIIADGSESYVSKAGVKKAVRKLNDDIVQAGHYLDIVEVDL